MRRLALILLSLASVAAVPSAQACDCGGCAPTDCGTSSSASPDGGLLFLRTYGQRGPLTAVDTASGGRAFTLPPGILSADGRRYVTAIQRARRFTTVRAYDARTGRELRAHTYRGGGWSLAGVSANGRYVALLDSFPKSRVTIKIIGSRLGRVLHTIALHGSYDVDAVSNDGRKLFLIQYLRSGYLVRFYDVGRQALASQVLTEKGAPMQGLAWDAVPSRDGHYLFTLYLRGDGAAEVHTLDLRQGTATCIDLPRGDPLSIQQYALSLSPNGRTLFAANPTLRVVATVHVRARRVTRVVHFHPNGLPTAQSQLAVASHDGRTVYFTSDRELYAYDSAYHVVRGPYRVGSAVSGLAFTRDDRRLLVVHAGRRLDWLNAATGERLR
jgi:hypothetical protein